MIFEESLIYYQVPNNFLNKTMCTNVTNVVKYFLLIHHQASQIQPV
jgi:hypothetical protein